MACMSSEADDVTVGEPLSAANISEKLQNEFVIAAADSVYLIAEKKHLLLTVGLNVECKQLHIFEVHFSFLRVFSNVG